MCAHHFFLLGPEVLDLVGAILATVGGALLAAPTLRDSLNRRRGFGIDIWMSEEAGRNPDRRVAEEAHLRAAQENIDRAVRRGYRSDLRMLRVGFLLLVVGLGLSVPIKLVALVCD